MDLLVSLVKFSIRKNIILSLIENSRPERYKKLKIFYRPIILSYY